MDEEINKLFNKLDIKIDTLSERLEQYINQTNNEISQLKQQEITKLSISEKTSLPSKVKNPTSSKNKNSNTVLARKKIKNEYLIDYSYIDIEKYPELKDDLDTLKEYSKQMAECRNYNRNLPNFCMYGRNTLERAVKMFLKYEYQYLNDDNTVFLEAYDKIKKAKDNEPPKSNSDWKLPNIYADNITGNDYKQIGSKCISWERIDNLGRSSLPSSIKILCEIIKPNFEKNNLHTNNINNYFQILQALITIRNKTADAHDRELNKLYGFPRKIYDTKNFEIMKEAIEWFVKEVYKRLEKLSNNLG